MECSIQCPNNALNKFDATNAITATVTTIYYTDPKAGADLVTICKKIVYAQLPGAPSVDPCAGFYDLNTVLDYNAIGLYKCVAAVTNCVSEFANQNKVCAKSLTVNNPGATENGLAHPCESVITPLLVGTTKNSMSPSIRE